MLVTYLLYGMRDNLYRVYTRAEKRVAATCYSAWTIDEPWGSSKGKKSRFFVCTWAAASHSSPPTLLALFPVLPTLEDIESIFIYFFFSFFFYPFDKAGGRNGKRLLAHVYSRSQSMEQKIKKSKRNSYRRSADAKQNTLARLQSKPRLTCSCICYIYKHQSLFFFV